MVELQHKLNEIIIIIKRDKLFCTARVIEVNWQTAICGIFDRHNCNFFNNKQCIISGFDCLSLFVQTKPQIL